MTEKNYADGALILTPGRVARLTLSAPATRNAMTRAMWQELPDALAAIAETPETRVLILTGAGGAFSAGADIGEFETVYASPESAAAYNALVRTALATLHDLPLPVLAWIEGPCVGGGVGLALACDLRFAAETAVFAITPSRLGIAYSPEDTAMLVAVVGVAAAKDLLYSGRRITTTEAHTLGLIDRVTASDALDQTVTDYAEKLAAASPAALRHTKRTIAALATGRSDPDLHTQFAALFSGPDFAEGRRAFLERRNPRF